VALDLEDLADHHAAEGRRHLKTYSNTEAHRNAKTHSTSCRW
jgi:hypothetical protein